MSTGSTISTRSTLDRGIQHPQSDTTRLSSDYHSLSSRSSRSRTSSDLKRPSPSRLAIRGTRTRPSYAPLVSTSITSQSSTPRRRTLSDRIHPPSSSPPSSSSAPSQHQPLRLGSRSSPPPTRIHPRLEPAALSPAHPSGLVLLHSTSLSASATSSSTLRRSEHWSRSTEETRGWSLSTRLPS